MCLCVCVCMCACVLHACGGRIVLYCMQAFVREVTGCGELADKTDTSCNIYAQGGHLLCHDDVIGTRR